MPVARIKIISRNAKDVAAIARQIIEIAKALNVKRKGPVPLPTRRLKIATRKTPAADGSHTFDHWEMRIHKWLVEIDGSEQALRQVMRIPVPDSVQIEMALS
ncbi:MAG: 30S ribosomal protein S10 [Candidatus Micrarchaeota archaeon]|nr:30S ribosomal protein S10 [Candidatus Micrarchaeota archaeon]MDE1804522.1 30S ribosomal protein S10 [Candidatus Micrarchaeota archaeon]MDE1846963.1 30S ribosomal protein S10 [Candidatus Micrarchaeota archaeon]